MSNVGVTGGKSTVYVGGLDQSVSEDSLHAAFIPFGEITSILIPKEFHSHDHHRGFGFVEYELADDAKAAIDNMHLSELYGKTIKCSIAKPSKIGELTGGSSKTRAIWEQDEWLQKYGTGPANTRAETTVKTDESETEMGTEAGIEKEQQE